MSANPNHPEDDALPSTSSDTRGLIDEGGSNRNRTVRQRSSIEADSDDEIHDDGAQGGAHPFQAAPEYRDAILRHLNEHVHDSVNHFISRFIDFDRIDRI